VGGKSRWGLPFLRLCWLSLGFVVKKKNRKIFAKLEIRKFCEKKCKNFAKKFEIENKNANFLRKFI